jgi:hypothetical protein
MWDARLLPDVREIQAAGYGLTDALALWNRFQNSPGMTPESARAYLLTCQKQPAPCETPIAASHLQLSQVPDSEPRSSPNVIQFSPPRSR